MEPNHNVPLTATSGVYGSTRTDAARVDGAGQAREGIVTDRPSDAYKVSWLKYCIVFSSDPPALTTKQWLVILLLGGVSFCASYDGFIFRLSLLQMQQDLNLENSELSSIASIISLSNIAGLPLLLATDRWGRRTILMLTVIPFTVFTGLTALCRNGRSFVFCQFFAGLFGAMEWYVSHIVIIEEMPANARGWATGVMGALGTVGSGAAVLLYGFLGNQAGGWRWLYGIAVIPLMFLTFLRRKLPETERFAATQVVEEDSSSTYVESFPQGGSSQEIAGKDTFRQRLSCAKMVSHGVKNVWWKFVAFIMPVKRLLVDSQRQAIFAFLLGFFANFSGAAPGLNEYKFMQQVHGLSAIKITLITCVGGMISLGFYSYAGQLSDRFGRRTLLSLIYVLCAIVGTGYYCIVPSTLGTAVAVILWVTRSVLGMGLATMSTALVFEVFPTSHRATAQVLAQIAASTGLPSGFAVERFLAKVSGSEWYGTAIMASLNVVCAVIVIIGFPETAGRELEDINNDDCSQTHSHAGFASKAASLKKNRSSHAIAGVI